MLVVIAILLALILLALVNRGAARRVLGCFGWTVGVVLSLVLMAAIGWLLTWAAYEGAKWAFSKFGLVDPGGPAFGIGLLAAYGAVYWLGSLWWAAFSAARDMQRELESQAD